MLRLFGTGPEGQMLMALGRGPLRTKQLTERVSDFSPRSVYRCVGKMKAYGLVDRSEEPSVPSKVLLRLSEPSGRSLFRLLRTTSTCSHAALPTPRESTCSWDALCLLGELWGFGFVEELSIGPRSLIELVDVPSDLTYHQVKRRMSLFTDSGFLEPCPQGGNGRHYRLADQGRRCMALVCGIGRWRHRYGIADGTPGLEIGEMVTVLRTVLPLALLPEHTGMSLELVVAGSEDRYGRRDTATLRATVGSDGSIGVSEALEQPADGYAAATINTWFAALLDDHRGRIRVRGDLGFVDACLRQLYEVLWKRPRGSFFDRHLLFQSRAG